MIRNQDAEEEWFDGTLQGFKAITSEDNHILSATASRTYPLTLQNLYFRPRTCPGNYSPSKCDGMHTCIVTDQETHGRGSHGSEKSSGEFQGLGATSQLPASATTITTHHKVTESPHDTTPDFPSCQHATPDFTSRRSFTTRATWSLLLLHIPNMV